MSNKPAPTKSSQDWLIGSLIGLAMLALAVAAWWWSQRQPDEDPTRPKPVWVDVERVRPQMADGGMANIKVDLQIDDAEQQKTLSALAPAFQSLIQERGSDMTREELTGPEGMRRLAKAIRSDVNNYLRAQRQPGRVLGVAFQEFHILP
ncbi:flagellar basal body-associated protein FliL [Aquabacterium sp.]|jgi:flagellar basal body-associated protein FliL|uniref:flagellar basal body-associated FliL family protein n=1 Tax=Aquabacterium sp. TaxID=1872578 RepID=UPI0025B8497F|nr:flagellar basal body-associated FliL family protein [Aquabacterium sp.]